MQSIDNYINERLSLNNSFMTNERLSLNNQSKLKSYSEIEINIDEKSIFTKNEINDIIDFFKAKDIPIYEITNNSLSTFISLQFKSIYWRDTTIKIQKCEKNHSYMFVPHAYWYPTATTYEEYFIKGSITFKEVINIFFQKIIKNEKFLKSLKK